MKRLIDLISTSFSNSILNGLLGLAVLIAFGVMVRATLPAGDQVPVSLIETGAEGPVSQAGSDIYLPFVIRSPSGWSSQTSGVGNLLLGVSCTADGQNCMAVGSQIALYTNNGGNSWSPVTPAGIAGLVLNDVSCPSASRCVAVGQRTGSAGIILVTNNAGGSWTPFNQSYRMDAVDCISTSECVAVGNDSEARFTFNGGASWGSGRLGNTPLFGIDCISSKTCWMVGVGGRVIGTYPNAGGPGGIGVISKKDLLLAEEKSLLSISCVQQSTCVTVGEIGKIFKTTNTGGNWSSQSSGTGVTLTGVSCPGSSLCYTVGDGGTILISNDDGSTWAPDDSPVAVNLKDIDCYGPTNCLAVGAGGTILLRQ
ncbi:MAG: hypothetical protein KDI79_26930 [Anaerolineae bacterium]|nr:hypothetical protein [Anaerolineae bacterium]